MEREKEILEELNALKLKNQLLSEQLKQARLLNENNFQVNSYQNFNISLEDLKVFVDYFEEIVIIKDYTGRWLFINKAASYIFNFSYNDWFGKTNIQLSEEFPDFNTFLLSCNSSDKEAWKQREVIIVEEITNTKKHKEKSFRMTKTPVFDSFGNPKYLLVMGKDISGINNNELLGKIQFNIANSVVTATKLNELYQIVERELSQVFDTTNMYIANYNETTNLLKIEYEQNTINDDITEWKADKSLSGYCIKSRKSVLLDKNDIAKLHEKGEIDYIGEPADCWLGVPLIKETKVIGIIVFQSYNNLDEYSHYHVSMLENIANQIVIYLRHKHLEETVRMLSKATEESPISVIITDPEGKIEYINKKFIEMTEYQFEDIIGIKPDYLNSNILNDEYFNKLWQIIKKGEDWYGEICSRTKSGELIWENVWIYKIVNERNEIIHFVSVKENITDLKKLLVDLSHAKEIAEENNQLKSAFLSNMSHEIRTPMNAIIGFSSLLDDETLTSEDRKEFIGIINKKGNDLLSLINDILDLSKLESNQLNLYFSENIINPLFYDLLKLFRNLIESTSLNDMIGNKKHLSIKIGKTLTDSVTFSTDFTRINQILTNLISNAIKFTEDGEIEFGCYPENENYLLFYVKDSGIGISKDKQELIFERFQQADSNFRTRKYGGTGLGLSIAKGLVELLGGKLWVESEVNIGSTFYFDIPVIFNYKNEVINNIIEEEEVDETLDILVVEDESSNYLLVESILKRNFTAKIKHAWNGAEAVEMVKAKKDYSLILMDIKMPIMNGFEALAAIRQDNKHVPIVAITAYAMNEEKDKITDAGFNGYLSKPFKTVDLVNAVSRIIKNKNLMI